MSPNDGVTGDNRSFQYPAQDACSCQPCREPLNEHSAYSLPQFFRLTVHTTSIIREFQTVNGKKLTKRILFSSYGQTLFEAEWQRRINEIRFDHHMRMDPLKNGRTRLARFLAELKSALYQGVMESEPEEKQCSSGRLSCCFFCPQKLWVLFHLSFFPHLR